MFHLNTRDLVQGKPDLFWEGGDLFKEDGGKKDLNHGETALGCQLSAVPRCCGFVIPEWFYRESRKMCVDSRLKRAGMTEPESMVRDVLCVLLW